jgi:protein ImuB
VRLIERLQARLGADRVQRLVPVADHRPERSTAYVPVDPGTWPQMPDLPGAVAPPLGPAQPGAGGMPTRPTMLLPKPQPLPARDGQPLFEGKPIEIISGPERIETGWWDGDLVARDYFVGRVHDGAMAWLFRDRIPPRAGERAAGSGWYLHGWFA